MRRSFEAYLWDIESAAALLTSFVQGKSEADYLGDLLLRSAVERQFTIIGEAASQMRRHFPEESQVLEQGRDVVAFRNLIVHEYPFVKQTTVWRIVQDHLPKLLADVSGALCALTPGQHPQ